MQKKKMYSNQRKIGSEGESLARTYLEQKNFKLIGQNLHMRWGELDLIMQDQDTLVFVEVKYKNNHAFGSPLEAITPAKQRKIIQTARYYLLKNPYTGPIRFDVLGITQLNPGQFHYEYVPNAIEGMA